MSGRLLRGCRPIRIVVVSGLGVSVDYATTTEQQQQQQQQQLLLLLLLLLLHTAGAVMAA